MAYKTGLPLRVNFCYQCWFYIFCVIAVMYIFLPYVACLKWIRFCLRLYLAVSTESYRPSQVEREDMINIHAIIRQNVTPTAAYMYYPVC